MSAMDVFKFFGSVAFAAFALWDAWKGRWNQATFFMALAIYIDPRV